MGGDAPVAGRAGESWRARKCNLAQPSPSRPPRPYVRRSKAQQIPLQSYRFRLRCIAWPSAFCHPNPFCPSSPPLPETAYRLVPPYLHNTCSPAARRSFPPVLSSLACAHSQTACPVTRYIPYATQHPWVRDLRRSSRPPPSHPLTPCTAEKRPSTEGLVDNVDPRESQELQELPKYEEPAEPAPIPLKEKLITCFWIGLNTFSTLGLIFLSKRYARNAETGDGQNANSGQCV